MWESTQEIYLKQAEYIQTKVNTNAQWGVLDTEVLQCRVGVSHQKREAGKSTWASLHSLTAQVSSTINQFSSGPRQDCNLYDDPAL